MRRLNRKEYQNTINDIFGTNLNLADKLPEDGKSHEFDNIGSALGMSMQLLRKYLEIIEENLDHSILLHDDKPMSENKKYSYINHRRSKEFIGNFWKKLEDDSIVRFSQIRYPNGVVPKTNVKDSGFYKIKIHGYSYQSETPITFHVGGISYKPGSEKPIYGFLSLPPNKMTTVELTTFINKNFMLSIEPYGINDPQVYNRKKDLLSINDYKGPGLAIHSVELEGPIVHEYPNRGYKLIFGDLSRSETMPSNPKHRLSKWYKPRFEIQTTNELQEIRVTLESVAKKAFRRDVVDIVPYLNLYSSERFKKETIENALRTSISAIFCSPDFLYLKENKGLLDDYEIASRLSYFLNRTLPDEKLMLAAKNGKLSSPDEIEQQFLRLIEKDHFKRFIDDFSNAWLNLREMDFTAPDKELFPEFDTYLRHSMPMESKAFLKELIKSNLSIDNVIKSDFAMLNERLAEHYGIDGVKGAQIRKVKLPNGSLRGGILSQSAVLKVSANGTNTSPIVRGIWVLERIMGITPPPPPAGVPGVEPDIRGAETLRQILEKHRNVSSCQGCHQKIDPMGFALEEFNPIGGERTFYRSLAKKAPKINKKVDGKFVRYKQGPTVDPSGIFLDGKKFTGFKEYREILYSQKEQLAKAFTKKILTFATGREMGFSD